MHGQLYSLELLLSICLSIQVRSQPSRRQGPSHLTASQSLELMGNIIAAFGIVLFSAEDGANRSGYGARREQ